MSSTAIVRRAEAGDAESLAPLLRAELAHAIAVGGMGLVPPNSISHAQSLLANPQRWLWIAEVEARPTGFIQLQWLAPKRPPFHWRFWLRRRGPKAVPGKGRMLVLGLYVAPEYRHQGLARQLLSAAEAKATEAGMSKIEISVLGGNLLALHFWSAAGYATNHILMSRPLR